MSIKKPSVPSNSAHPTRSQAKKQEPPLIIWYNRNDEEKTRENNLTSYNNSEECLQAIEQSSKAIFLILNSSSATDLLSRIHPLKQIDTIFIFCKSSREQQRCQYLLQHYSKVFDLFLDRQQLLKTLNENIHLYENQSGNDYLRLAERYKEQNEFNHALKYTHKALDIFQKTLANPNHPLIGRCFNNLGGICDAQGDVNRSFEYYEKAIKIYSNLTPSLASQPVSNLLKK